MHLHNLSTRKHSPQSIFLYRIPPVPNEADPTFASVPVQKSASLSFVPVDASPKTQLSNFLRLANSIDANWSPISNNSLSFCLDGIQEQWMEKILNMEISVTYQMISCKFTVKALIDHVFKNCPVKIKNSCLIGGITRFLVRSSPDFCASILNELGAKIDPKFLHFVLQHHSEYLPDLDIRFELDFIEPQEKENVLDQCRSVVIDFISIQLQQVSFNPIVNTKVEKKSLLKNRTIVLEGISYSIIACGQKGTEFSRSIPSIECLFISDLGEKTHLSSRDNLQMPLSCGSNKNTKHAFSSYGNKQLKAIIHILLAKIELEHDINIDGLVRVISLLTQGNTLVNTTEDLQKRFDGSSKISIMKNLAAFWAGSITKCLNNHHSQNPEIYPLLLYNFTSALDPENRETCSSWLWPQLCGQKKEIVLTEPISLTIVDLICNAKVSFELIEAVLGLAAIVQLSQIDVRNPNPKTILCEHGKEIHIQMNTSSGYLLIPFRPEIFFKRLVEGIYSENAGALCNLFFTVVKALPSQICEMSLLEAYIDQLPHVFEKLIWQISHPHTKTKFLSEIKTALEKSLLISDIATETFLSKIQKTSSHQERVIFWRKLCRKLSGTRLGELLKSREKTWIKYLNTPLQMNMVVSLWVDQLLEAGGSHINQALEICHSDDQHYGLLTSDFFYKHLPRFLSFHFSSGQRLIRMSQRKAKNPLSLNEEFGFVMQMLKELQTKATNICASSEVNSALSILKKFLKRYKKEKNLPLTFDQIGISFIKRLFYEGFHEEAEALLPLMTELNLIPKEASKTSDLWVCSYALKNTHKNKAHVLKTHLFWQRGQMLDIWKSQNNCGIFAQAMTDTIEALSAINPCGKELNEMLLAFHPSTELKTLCKDKIEPCAAQNLEKLLGQKQNSSTLEQIRKRLAGTKHHLTPRTEDPITLSLFKAHVPLNLWDHALELWKNLMASEERNLSITKIGQETAQFLHWLLKHKQFKTIQTLLQHQNIHELYLHLRSIWASEPIRALEFLKEHKQSIAKEWQIAIAQGALERISSQTANKEHPELAWEALCLAMQDSSTEGIEIRRKCCKEFLLFLKNNKSPLLKNFFENASSENFPFQSLLDPTGDPQIYLELIILLLKSLHFSQAELFLDAKISESLLLNILIKAEPFKNVEELKPFYTPIVDTYTFLIKIQNAATDEQRLFFWRVLENKLSSSANSSEKILGSILKKKEEAWIKRLSAKKFSLNKIIRSWIDQLIDTGEPCFFEEALKACKKYHGQGKMLCFDLCKKILPPLLSKSISHAKKLIFLVQEECRPVLSMEQEFWMVSELIKTPQEALGALKILGSFVECYKNESSLNFGESGIAFLEKLFSEGAYEEAKTLLQKMTESKLVPTNGLKTSELWLNIYAKDSSKKKTQSIEAYNFWKEGEDLGVWASQAHSPTFIKAMLDTIEALNEITAYRKQQIMMLKRFKPSKECKKLFTTKIETFAKGIFDTELKQKQTEKSLSILNKDLIDLAHHLQLDTRYKIALSIFQAHFPLKLWDKAFKIIDRLMKQPGRGDYLEKIGPATAIFLTELLKNQQFATIEKLLGHQNFNDLKSYLEPIWKNLPIHTFEFLKTCKNSLKKESKISISEQALEGVALLPKEKQCYLFSKPEISEFCDKEQIDKQVCALILELIKTPASTQAIEKCLSFLSLYRPKNGSAWVAVFESLPNSFEAKPLLRLLDICLEELPPEAVDAKLLCSKVVLEWITNHKSSTEKSFLEAFLSKESPLIPLLKQTQNIKLRIETLLLLADILNKGISILPEPEGMIAEIINIANITEEESKKFKEHKTLISSYLSILNRLISVSKEIEALRIAVVKTEYFLTNARTFVLEEPVLELLKKAIEWEDDHRFAQWQIRDRIVIIADLFSIGGSEKRLQKIVCQLSLYKSEEIINFTPELFIQIAFGKRLNPKEVTHHVKETLKRGYNETDISLEQDNNTFTVSQQVKKESKPLLPKTDSKLGKAFLRCGEKIKKNDSSIPLAKIRFLLHSDLLSKHLCLKSLNFLFEKFQNIPNDLLPLQNIYGGAMVIVNDVIERTKIFAPDQDLLDNWRRKIFNSILPFLTTGSNTNIFYRGFLGLFTELGLRGKEDLVIFTKKTNADKIMVCEFQFKTETDLSPKIFEKLEHECAMLLEFLEKAMVGDKITNNLHLEAFIGENLASIFEFLYHNKSTSTRIDMKKLTNIFERYMLLGSSDVSAYDFWERFTEHYDFIKHFEKIFLPTINKMFLSFKPKLAIRAHCMLQHVFVTNHLHGGLPLETGHELYKIAFDAFLEEVFEKPVNTVKKYLETMALSLVRPRRKFQLVSKGLEQHLVILDNLSENFVNVICTLIKERCTSDTEIFELQFFTIIYIYELSNVKDILKTQNKYKDTVREFIAGVNKTLDLQKISKIHNFFVRSVAVPLILIEIAKVEMPSNDSSLTLAKEWLLALKALEDPQARSIFIGQAIQFAELLKKNLGEKVAEKYAVPVKQPKSIAIVESHVTGGRIFTDSETRLFESHMDFSKKEDFLSDN